MKLPFPHANNPANSSANGGSSPPLTEYTD
jgi:hypothetical protein